MNLYFHYRTKGLGIIERTQIIYLCELCPPSLTLTYQQATEPFNLHFESMRTSALKSPLCNLTVVDM